jgi:hypothetical protein
VLSLRRGCHSLALLQQPIEADRWLLCCSLRHQCVGGVRLSGAQCRFGERKVNQVALREAPTTAMRDVAHAH